MDISEVNQQRKEAAATAPKRWHIVGGYDGARHALFVRQDGPWLDPGGATVEVAPAIEVSSYRAALQRLVRACPDWMKSGPDASPEMSRAVGLLAAWSGPDLVADPEPIARAFHDEYEAFAECHGWETQDASRVAFDDLPVENRQTMLSTVQALLDRGIILPGVSR